MKKNPLKILKTLKIDDKVEIEWMDHFVCPGWFYPKDIYSKPCICYSTGYFKGHDKIHFYMVSTLSRDQVGTILARIKSNILRIRKLKP